VARRNLFLSQRFATVKLMSKRSHSSSRARLLRLSQLRRRASGRSENAAPGSPNLKPHRTKARLSRLIAPLVVLALLLVGGNFYVRQNFNVEKIVRGQVIPQLEKQLQARVEIGRIESDYISGVTLHDVVIGRDKNLPLGALAQVKTATINLDIPSLVLHRTDALGALRSVDLQSPRVVIRRDAKGQLNWAKLWKSSPDISATRWTGTLTAHDGRIWYQDATVRSRAGVPVVMDAQGVQAKVVANGANPATFAATIEQTSVGHKPQQTQLKNIALDGTADNRGRWLNANVRCARVPVALLIEYSNGRLPLSARGEIGGAVQVAYDAKAPVARRLLLAGQGAAREVDVALLPGASSANGAKFPAALTNLQTRLSRIGQPLALHKLNGAFRFDNRAFSTTGMTLQTLGSDWRISGNAAMPANSPVVAFDVRASKAQTRRNWRNCCRLQERRFVADKPAVRFARLATRSAPKSAATLLFPTLKFRARNGAARKREICAPSSKPIRKAAPPTFVFRCPNWWRATSKAVFCAVEYSKAQRQLCVRVTTP